MKYHPILFIHGVKPRGNDGLIKPLSKAKDNRYKEVEKQLKELSTENDRLKRCNDVCCQFLHAFRMTEDALHFTHRLLSSTCSGLEPSSVHLS